MSETTHERDRRANGRFTRSLELARRDAEACRLQAHGYTLQEISDRLGYNSTGSAHRGIQRALAETASLHGGRELRELMIARNREVQRAAWEIITDPPPALDRAGKPAMMPDGTVVIDAQAVIGALQVSIKADDRLARLVGADAPRKSVSVLAQVSPADIQARLAELRSELSAAGIDPDTLPGPGAITGEVIGPDPDDGGQS